MLNKILRKLNSRGRINIPHTLLETVEIYPEGKIAICYHRKGIMVKPFDVARDCKVIAITKMDKKGRFVFPNDLLTKPRNECTFEVYLYNGELIIEEV